MLWRLGPALTKAEICTGFHGLRNAFFNFSTERLSVPLFQGFVRSYVVKRVSTPPPARPPPASPPTGKYHSPGVAYSGASTATGSVASAGTATGAGTGVDTGADDGTEGGAESGADGGRWWGGGQGNGAEDVFSDDIAEEAGHLLGDDLTALTANLIQGSLVQGAAVQALSKAEKPAVAEAADVATAVAAEEEEAEAGAGVPGRGVPEMASSERPIFRARSNIRLVERSRLASCGLWARVATQYLFHGRSSRRASESC